MAIPAGAGGGVGLVTLEQVRDHRTVKTFIGLADRYLGELGYTEHGFRHAKIVARDARRLLHDLGRDLQEAERAGIAGYLHDIGNFVSREMHPQTGAILAHDILQELGMPLDEIVVVMGAIGNHEEGVGQPVSPEGAALILADKSDVHRSRVRNKDPDTFDIHDRVNYAAESSHVQVDVGEGTITLAVRIDTKLSRIMEYFEIFLERMAMCRRAAEFLGCDFRLMINESQLL